MKPTLIEYIRQGQKEQTQLLMKKLAKIERRYDEAGAKGDFSAQHIVRRRLEKSAKATMSLLRKLL